jgi:hypothetical protein
MFDFQGSAAASATHFVVDSDCAARLWHRSIGVDEGVLKRARIRALEQDTSVNAVLCGCWLRIPTAFLSIPSRYRAATAPGCESATGEYRTNWIVASW